MMPLYVLHEYIRPEVLIVLIHALARYNRTETTRSYIYFHPGQVLR